MQEENKKEIEKLTETEKEKDVKETEKQHIKNDEGFLKAIKRIVGR